MEVVRFLKLVPYGRGPNRASRDLGGTIPARALRYCEAFQTANGWGWYVYPLLRFGLARSGNSVIWTFEDLDHAAGERWHVLDKADYPDFVFDLLAPETSRGHAPHFLAMTQTGMVQVWTGLIARTAPGWFVLVRAPVNYPPSPVFYYREGLIETDRWFGPLFTNIVITQRDSPIIFEPDHPLLQVQPIPSAAVDGQANAFTINRPTINREVKAGLGLSAEEWQLYHDHIVSEPNRPLGSYAVAVRKRRKRGGP
jgi:hypothetical protein